MKGDFDELVLEVLEFLVADELVGVFVVVDVFEDGGVVGDGSADGPDEVPLFLAHGRVEQGTEGLHVLLQVLHLGLEDLGDLVEFEFLGTDGGTLVELLHQTLHVREVDLEEGLGFYLI